MTNTQKALDAVVQTKQLSLPQMIEQQMPKMLKVAPKHIDGTRYTAMAISLVKRNPELMKCNPYTILGSFFQCIELGLEPMDGQAYILPFRNKGQHEAQLIIGYKGLAQLFYRHESSISLEWGTVYENDFFDYEKGTSSFLKHKKADGERGEIKGYYVLAKLSKEGMIFDYMSKKECMDHGKKYSKTWSKDKQEFNYYSPWRTAEEQMCLKTVLRGIMKLLPKSVEMQKALEGDERITAYNPVNPPDSLLEMPDRTDWDQLEGSDKTIDVDTEPQQSHVESSKPSGTSEPKKKENATKGDFEPSSSKSQPDILRSDIVLMLSMMGRTLLDYTKTEKYPGTDDVVKLKNTIAEGKKKSQLMVQHSIIKKDYREFTQNSVPEVNLDDENLLID